MYVSKNIHFLSIYTSTLTNYIFRIIVPIMLKYKNGGENHHVAPVNLWKRTSNLLLVNHQLNFGVLCIISSTAYTLLNIYLCTVAKES